VVTIQKRGTYTDVMGKRNRRHNSRTSGTF